MIIYLRPTSKLRDELAANATAFRQTVEDLLLHAPLRVGYMWHLHQRSGGLPAILWEDTLNCLPFELVEDYRKHPFALQCTQAGQSRLRPADALESDTAMVEVPDRIPNKLASLVGASSSVEAYGYAVWFFNRTLNLAREDFPGGIPGFFSKTDRAFDSFFPMENHLVAGAAQLVAWDECHKFMALHAGGIPSSKRE